MTRLKYFSIPLVLGFLAFAFWAKPFEEPETTVLNTSDNQIFVEFALNVQELTSPTQSLETINRVLDIHETYDVGIDIFLTDPVAQNIIKNDPILLERLITSPVVAVSYHVRPPAPYYPSFDWLGIKSMDQEELYTTILEYEEHALDFTTGLPTDEPGGYEYLKELIGYAPKIVGMQEIGDIGKTATRIYQEKGAIFAVKHKSEIILGEMLYETLYLRPETHDLRLSGYAEDTQDGAKVIEEVVKDLPSSGRRFIGIKYHENDFYLDGALWTFMWDGHGPKKTANQPPFSLEPDITPLSEEEQAQHWQLYESTVKYISENREIYYPINAFDLEIMLENF